MNRTEFVSRYGNVYEHSPWVAERAWDGGIVPGADPAPVFRRIVERAGQEAQLALLRAHPDLAGRLGVALTAESAAEQAGAGLDRCTPEEFAEFTALNGRYVERFGFPFIIAVKGLDRAAILAAFRSRVDGAPQAEFRTALDQVHRIAGFRLAALAERPAPTSTAISYPDLHALVARAVRAAGASEEHADAVADLIARTERDGYRSHGLFRVPSTVAGLRSGFVNAAPRPRLLPSAPAVVDCDGDRGYAPLAYRVALPALAERAAAMGAAVLALHNVNHIAAMWPEVEWLAERGLAALACTGNFPYLAPHGGRRPIFGTNPIAFSYPRPGGVPVVFDFATAATARGEIMMAAREGRPAPPGVGIGPDGEETTDPDAILAGAQLAFGGHKGSALALMVELLCAGVVDDHFSIDAPSNGSYVPPGGIFILALSPERIGGARTVERAEAFLRRLETEPGVRLPGARRHAARGDGPLQVDAALLAEVRALAEGGQAR
jgi:delta1-piperideine-2-carboxylate reductase